MAVLLVLVLQYKQFLALNLTVLPTVLGDLGVTCLTAPIHVEAITLKYVILFLFQLDLHAMELALLLCNADLVLPTLLVLIVVLVAK